MDEEGYSSKHTAPSRHCRRSLLPSTPVLHQPPSSHSSNKTLSIPEPSTASNLPPSSAHEEAMPPQKPTYSDLYTTTAIAAREFFPSPTPSSSRKPTSSAVNAADEKVSPGRFTQPRNTGSLLPKRENMFLPSSHHRTILHPTPRVANIREPFNDNVSRRRHARLLNHRGDTRITDDNVSSAPESPLNATMLHTPFVHSGSCYASEGHSGSEPEGADVCLGKYRSPSQSQSVGTSFIDKQILR
jgi:hypothetical protein